jgi:hypothetical protein
MSPNQLAERCRYNKEMAEPDGFRLGPPRYFVPICVKTSVGFIAGPSGFVEFPNRREAQAAAPIIARRNVT